MTGGGPNAPSRAADDGTSSVADSRSKTAAEVAATYDGLSGWFDRFEPLEALLLGRARARLFGDADGRVLDVACGVGTNGRYLPAEATYVGVDVSRAMLDRARTRVPDGTALIEADAASLPFPDDSFDAVVSSLSTCTFPDPGTAVAEMARVCRPEGRLRLLEHGRSSAGPLARLQSWYAPRHYEHVGCRLDQDPIAVVREAGVEPVSVRTGYLGTVTAMVVRPT